jgi:hypothetical protein
MCRRSNDAVLSGAASAFYTLLFLPILKFLQELSSAMRFVHQISCLISFLTNTKSGAFSGLSCLDEPVTGLFAVGI